LRSKQFLSESNSLHFMEPGGSLPHSQQPATCHYLEPRLKGGVEEGGRSKRLRGLKRKAARFVGFRVRIMLVHGCSSVMFAAFCVGSGHCDGLITRAGV
jgi:hypothetical protein